MKKRVIYWKLATANGIYGLYFEEGNKDFVPSGNNFSRGILIEYLLEENKADFDNAVRNEMKLLSYSSHTKWVEAN